MNRSGRRRLLAWAVALLLLGSTAALARTSERQATSTVNAAGQPAAATTTTATTTSVAAIAPTTSTTSATATASPSLVSRPSATSNTADRCQGRGADDGTGGCNWYPTTIDGSVVDDHSHGIANVCVHLFPGPGEVDVTTIGDGSFRVVVDNLRQGAQSFANVSDCSSADPGWVDRLAIPVTVTPGTTNHLDAMALTAASAVDGQVVDVNGTPVAGACVSAAAADQGPTPTVTADGNGHFHLTHIHPGDNSVWAHDGCAVAYQGNMSPFTVDPGATAHVTVTVTRPGQQPSS
jgi:Carboxypeptidase regulatory-like domain